MNAVQFIEKKFRTKISSQGISRIPLADDGKSAFYFTVPFTGVYCWANDIYCAEASAGSELKFSGMILNYCAEGACDFSLMNDNSVSMKKGTLSIDRSIPKTPHRYPGGRYRGLEIAFDFDEIKSENGGMLSSFGFSVYDFLKKIEPLSSHGSFSIRAEKIWSDKADFLSRQIISQDLLIEEIRFYVLELLFLLSHGMNDFPSEKISYLTQGQKKIVSVIESMVSKNLSKRISIEILAKKYKISPSSLKKYFTQVYGMPFSAYFNKLRMETASRLIMQGKLSIGEIAEKVGYQNQSKFGAAFKKHFGKSPLEYKRLSCAENVK